jgi:hypothetical protein
MLTVSGCRPSSCGLTTNVCLFGWPIPLPKERRQLIYLLKLALDANAYLVPCSRVATARTSVRRAIFVHWTASTGGERVWIGWRDLD